MRKVSPKQSFLICVIFLVSSANLLFVYRQDIFSLKNGLDITLSRSGRVLRTGLTREDQQTSNSGNVTSQLWRQIGTSRALYIYSAYYVEDENIVKLVGMVLRRSNIPFFCVFQTHGSHGDKTEVPGEIEFLPENQNRKYCAVYIKCPLGSVVEPAAVHIVAENRTTSFQVLYPSPRRYNFTVCLSALHGPYRNYNQIIETLEADMIFGAEHFIIFNHSITPEIDRVLKHYVRLGKMKVLPWNMPNVDVHYFGQLVFLHDCILATRNMSRYLVFHDLDELIVPHKHRNWPDMITELEHIEPMTASHLFQSSFFHLNWGHDVENFTRSNDSERLKINSLLNVWREQDFCSIRVRSKMVVLPDHVTTTGIHFTRKRAKGYKETPVYTGIGYLHHYRNFKKVMHKVRDDTMRRYAGELITNVNKTFTQLGFDGNKK